jgi:hypothetical protein
VFIFINIMFNFIHSQESSMERIAAVESECFFVNPNRRWKRQFQNVSGWADSGRSGNVSHRSRMCISEIETGSRLKDRMKRNVLTLAQGIKENRVDLILVGILKDWLTMSVVIMAGAALTLLLG